MKAVCWPKQAIGKGKRWPKKGRKKVPLWVKQAPLSCGPQLLGPIHVTLQFLSPP